MDSADLGAGVTMQRKERRWLAPMHSGSLGRSGPMTRASALSRAVAVAWRRSLQLRVVALT